MDDVFYPKEIDDGGPAFPASMLVEGMVAYQPGMSLRDWIAGESLAQAIEDYDRLDRHTGQRVLPYSVKAIGTREEIIARQAYRYADAMLKARQS